MDRQISSDVVERWMYHLRRQRSRANDTIWLIETGTTYHEGRDGEPVVDVTDRWLKEQRDVVAEIDILTQLYHQEND